MDINDINYMMYQDSSAEQMHNKVKIGIIILIEIGIIMERYKRNSGNNKRDLGKVGMMFKDVKMKKKNEDI